MTSYTGAWPRCGEPLTGELVVEAPGGCRVLWRQAATSSNPDYDIEARLSKVMAGALGDLKAKLEAA